MKNVIMKYMKVAFFAIEMRISTQFSSWALAYWYELLRAYIGKTWKTPKVFVFVLNDILDSFDIATVQIQTAWNAKSTSFPNNWKARWVIFSNDRKLPAP